MHCCDSFTTQKGPTQRSHAPLQQYLMGAPMERAGVDILGPFPVTDSGNCYVLVAMYHLTKWPKVYVVPDQSATTTAERLVEKMFTRFGVPAELHSDQGRNLEPQAFSEVCRCLGVSETRTTTLHLQSDGMMEWFNHTLATQLAILTNQHQPTPAGLGPPLAPGPVVLLQRCPGIQPAHACCPYVWAGTLNTGGHGVWRPT